jgi:hypothetical protein
MKLMRMPILAVALLASGVFGVVAGTGAQLGRAAKPAPTTTQAATTTSSSVSGTWKVVPSASTTSRFTSLNAVAVAAANDVWAVGRRDSSTLIERWNGSKWNEIGSPSPGSSSNRLNAVAVAGASDVWAVGDSVGADQYYKTLIEHWDGAKWSVVVSPNVGRDSNNQLHGVAVVSAADIWAVGSYANKFTNGGYQSLVQHWDGTSWRRIETPILGSEAFLWGVAAVSATDVWAVGASGGKTLVLHWNGVAWSVVTSPSDAIGGNQLRAIAAVTANDIWAVGSSYNGALTLHWNGAAWRRVASPPGVVFESVSAASGSDVWAVGWTYGGQINFKTVHNTLIGHWDGSAWSAVASPNPSEGTPPFNELYGVAVVSSRDAWAVGTYTTSGNQQYLGLIERYTAP